MADPSLTVREADPESPGQVTDSATLRERLERAVGGLGMMSHRAPWATLLTVTLIVGLFASQLPKTHFLADIDRYLLPDDPIRVQYDRLREQFGRDDFLLIAITTDGVFEPSSLETLREIHERLEEELPYLDEVQSLVNARQTRGEGETLVVGELLEDWPESAGEIAAVERIARANPLYRDLYLSGDGRTAGIVVRPLTYSPTELDMLGGFDEAGAAVAIESAPEFLNDAQLAELVVGSLALAAEYERRGLEIVVGGSPALNHQIQELSFAELVRFSLLSFGSIGLLLWIVFRRLAAVVLPLFIVMAAVLSSIGMMAAAGRPLTFVSQIVPSFILAVGVGFAVHVLAIFFQRLDRGAEVEQAVEGALHHAGPAIVMSSLTTAGGMLSFVPTGLLPIRDVGIFVPLGVLLAAGLSISALPAALAILPVRPRPVTAGSGDLLTERVLEACGRFGTRHPRAITLASFVLLGLFAAGIPRITRDYDPLSWLPRENAVRRGIESIDDRMGGASGMEIVFDSGRENGLHDPEILHRLERLQRYAEKTRSEGVTITKTISVGDIAKEIHQALHGGDPAEYRIADDGRLIAQELLLFENAGSDDLEDVVDSQFRLARITLKSPQVAAGQQTRFLGDHAGPMREIAGDDASLAITGFFALASQVAVHVAETAIRSYALAFLLITPLMILFIGSFRTGIVSMAPNLMPILIVLGVMGWSGAPLDIISVLVGGIALGLVVDDTIHILHGFRREFDETGDVEEATVRTMRTTGRALFFTTAVLTVAFSIYAFAESSTVANFGWLTALAVALAFLFDVFLSPALLMLVYGRQRAGTSEIGPAGGASRRRSRPTS